MIRRLTGQDEPRTVHSKTSTFLPVNINYKSDMFSRTFVTKTRIYIPFQTELSF
jgi:hypothetical protein